MAIKFVKNVKPTCVSLTPCRYQKLLEKRDDAYLLALAQKRERTETGATCPAEEVYKKLDIDADFDEIPMEYGIDFE